MADAGQAIWRRAGREPSGHQFNSLVQVEYDQGVPHSPFINAGALVVDELLGVTGDAYGAVVELLRDQGAASATSATTSSTCSTTAFASARSR